MLGKPKYNYDDIVKFKMTHNDKEVEIEGTIYIIDAYGTFEQNEEVSYDIMTETSPIMNEPCLFKHIRESWVYKDE